MVTEIKTTQLPVATELPPPKPLEHHHPKPPPKHAVASRPEPNKSPEAVQAKFKTVNIEYTAFKTQYGGVLEDRWNAIASEITFGKVDKFAKVDQMLDQLRKEMAKVRSGG